MNRIEIPRREKVYRAILIGVILAFVVYGTMVPMHWAWIVESALLGVVLHMRRVFPESIDTLTPLAFLLPLLLFGSHLAMRWIYRYRNGEKAVWKWCWTASGIAIVLAMFLLVMACVGIVHQIYWLSQEQYIVLEVNPLSVGGMARHHCCVALNKKMETAEFRRYLDEHKDDHHRYKYVILDDDNGLVRGCIVLPSRDARSIADQGAIWGVYETMERDEYSPWSLRVFRYTDTDLGELLRCWRQHRYLPLGEHW